MLILICSFIAINLISFITMYVDKKLAIQNKRRISEKTLFKLALCLGGLGIFSGMYAFRHKTKHKKFVILIPILTAINFICIYFILIKTFLYFNRSL